jgi:hypothetical protein
MHPSLRIALSATVLVSLVACGGGGGGSSPAAVSGAALSGKVIDGPISGATVCLDVNSNNTCDTGEPTATTDATGNYTLPSYTDSTDGLHILAIVPAGAIDLDTNTAVTTGYVLMAPASNPSAVTPLTTLVSTQMLANPSLSAASAEQATLVSNNLGKQTTAILDVDVTANAGLHKVAQAVVSAIAQTSSALVGNTTFTTAANSSNDGTTASMASKQAMRLTQSMLLQQMQNSDGAINSTYHSNGAVNTNAINTLATNTVNDAISYIAATTKAGKSTKVDMAAALTAGITGFKIAGGGYYLDSSNSVQGIGQYHYKVERMSTVSGKNGQLRDINGTWRKSSLNNYDLIAGAWIAEYSNAAGTISSAENPPTVTGNCFTAAQTPNGINLTACAMAVDLTGKKLSDFNFDCKDVLGAAINGCNVNATFPAGSIGYNFQVLYDEDQYQLEIPSNGTAIATNMNAFISTYMQSGGPYQYFSGSDIAMNIASYDSATKTGVFNWYDNSSGSFTSVAETSPFTVTTLNGVDVLTGNLPNVYYRLGGGSDQTVLFSYAPTGTNTGSQAGVYRGNKYSSKLATNVYFGMTEQNMMNSTAYNFVAAKYQLPALP